MSIGTKRPPLNQKYLAPSSPRVARDLANQQGSVGMESIHLMNANPSNERTEGPLGA
jgi:hypothetical protein